jgi:AAA family ATP:ADP antiporter
MGLLFWGLANEITNLSDAATLYPLFGLGANLAQALAGLVLKVRAWGLVKQDWKVII